MIATAKAIGYGRASFDRCKQLRVQPTAYGRIAEPSGLGVAPQATPIKMIRLTSTLKDGRLRGFFAT